MSATLSFWFLDSFFRFLRPKVFNFKVGNVDFFFVGCSWLLFLFFQLDINFYFFNCLVSIKAKTNIN
jgi:hypothetical protein